MLREHRDEEMSDDLMRGELQARTAVAAVAACSLVRDFEAACEALLLRGFSSSPSCPGPISVPILRLFLLGGAARAQAQPSSVARVAASAMLHAARHSAARVPLSDAHTACPWPLSSALRQPLPC